jgi:integrase
MACIRQRRGKWVCDFRDQNSIRRWKTFDLRKDAQSFLAKTIGEIQRNEFQSEREQIDFGELVTVFDKAHITTLRPATATSYRGLIKLHLQPFFGSVRLRKITPALIERFRAELSEKAASERGSGARTTNKALGLLALMLSYAERHGWVASNPVRHVRRLRVEQRKVEPLNPAQVCLLIESATAPMWKALLGVAGLTGMRQGEILGLRWSDIDFTSKTISVRRSFTGGKLQEPKTASGRRTINMPDALASILKPWKLQCPPTKLSLCFPSSKGQHLDAGAVIRFGLRPALKAAGLPQIRFHDLRHSFASTLLASGMDLPRVSKTLGHAGVQITLMVYSHVVNAVGSNVGDRVDQLFAGLGSKVVAAGGSDFADPIVIPPQVVDFAGARSRTRTGTDVTPRDFKSLVSTDFTIRAPGRG